MAIAKGKRFGGRQKGTPNKVSASVKDAIIKAFDKAGGANYLFKIAKEDPKTFCSLLGRIVPTEIAGSLAVKDDRTPEQIRASIVAKAEALGIVLGDLD